MLACQVLGCITESCAWVSRPIWQVSSWIHLLTVCACNSSSIDQVRGLLALDIVTCKQLGLQPSGRTWAVIILRNYCITNLFTLQNRRWSTVERRAKSVSSYYPIPPDHEMCAAVLLQCSVLISKVTIESLATIPCKVSLLATSLQLVVPFLHALACPQHWHGSGNTW